MKIIISTFLLFISHFTFAQCKDCKSLKEALTYPENVKTITYNGAINEPLDSLPASIGECKNLTSLLLSDNLFLTVPKEIGNLKNLRVLSFAGCRLTSLPEEIFTLTNLKDVYLSNNNFSEKYLKMLKAKFAAKLPDTKVLFD